MKSLIVLVGLLFLLIGVGIFLYSEINYQSKMSEIWDMRGELRKLILLAQDRYIETGDPKYLSDLAKIEGLYSETFYIEGQIKSAKWLGSIASSGFIFFGIPIFILGILAKEK